MECRPLGIVARITEPWNLYTNPGHAVNVQKDSKVASLAISRVKIK